VDDDPLRPRSGLQRLSREEKEDDEKAKERSLTSSYHHLVHLSF